MTNEQITPDSPTFKNRKAGLIIFGIIHIIGGAMCVMAIPFMLMSILFASFGGEDIPMQTSMMQSMISACIVYAVFAAWLIWSGIGSIKGRRWARALILIASWLWLSVGVVTLLYMIIALPEIYSSAQIPQEAVLAVQVITFVTMSVFYILVPGVYVFFFSSRKVKAVCDIMDPTERWTDRCPLPVLGICVACAFWCICTPAVALYNFILPFFGQMITGLAGAAAWLAVTALLAYTAWSSYRVKISGWWCALFVTIAYTVSTAMTFSRISVIDMYKEMGLVEEELLEMAQYSFMSSSMITLMCVAWAACALAYLVYARRFFTPASPPPLPETS